MPTKNPRINVVLEKPLYNSIEVVFKIVKDGVWILASSIDATSTIGPGREPELC